jgi:hypothetical protein
MAVCVGFDLILERGLYQAFHLQLAIGHHKLGGEGALRPAEESPEHLACEGNNTTRRSRNIELAGADRKGIRHGKGKRGKGRKRSGCGKRGNVGLNPASAL